MIVINGVDIATPSTFQVEISDIDGETNRNAKGEMLRDRITTKRKLNCEWGVLSSIECSTLLKAVKDIFFTVTYPDPMEGGPVTKTFYVGDRTAPALYYKNNQVFWKELKMNFIEK